MLQIEVRPAEESLDKLAMISVILATVAVPVLCARDRRPRRGVRRMVLLLLLFNALYIAYVTAIHTTFFRPPPWPWSR